MSDELFVPGDFAVPDGLVAGEFRGWRGWRVEGIRRPFAIAP
jgi:hypothetical protein